MTAEQKADIEALNSAFDECSCEEGGGCDPACQWCQIKVGGGGCYGLEIVGGEGQTIAAVPAAPDDGPSRPRPNFLMLPNLQLVWALNDVPVFYRPVCLSYWLSVTQQALTELRKLAG